MDTEADEVPVGSGTSALARRIEEVAARGGRDGSHQPLAPVLTAALTGLRRELGGLRADVVGLRDEVDALRARPSADDDRRDDTGELRSQVQRLDERQAEVLDRIEALTPLLGDAELSQVVTAAVAAGLETRGASPSAAVEPLRDLAAAMEERLAAVEDTLDGLAERLEAVGRSSMAETTQRLRSLDERVNEQAGALDQWGDVVRGALSELGDAVERSLGTLSTSLAGDLAARTAAAGTSGGPSAEEWDELRGELAAIRNDLAIRLTGAQQTITAEVRDAVSALPAVRTVVEAGRDQLVEELGALRTDLADALDEVRDRVTETVGESATHLSAAVQEQLADNATAAASSGDRSRDAVMESVATVRSELTGLTAAGQASADRLAEVEAGLTQVQETLTAMAADWQPRTDAVVAEGRAAALSVVAEVRDLLRDALAAVTDALAGQVSAVREASTVLDGGTSRLTAAGQSLLAYLADRDRRLEQERDQVLAGLIEEFAAGMTDKERKRSGTRLAEALERRRNARDAQRYRDSREQPEIEIPPVPAAVSAAAAPTAEPAAPPAEQPAAPANKTGPPAKRTAAAPVREAPAPPVKKAAAPVKKAAAPAKKSTRKTAAKSASTRKAAPAKQAKRAANSATRAGRRSPGGRAARG